MGSCVSEGGDCEVIWTSQNPRSSATVDQYSTPITINENLDASLPNRYDCPSHQVNHGPCPDDIADPTINPPGAPRGGRSTLTLVVNGEESFVDSNGNGFYDEGERWTNLTEAFTDHNEDRLYTPVQRANCTDPATADDVCLAGFEEFFYDFNSNGVFDLNDSPSAPVGSSLPDGLYNGVLCRQEDEAAGICSRELLNLSQSLEVILSPGAAGYDMLIVDSNGREPSKLSGRSYDAVRLRSLQQPATRPDNDYVRGQRWLLGRRGLSHRTGSQAEAGAFRRFGLSVHTWQKTPRRWTQSHSIRIQIKSRSSLPCRAGISLTQTRTLAG